MRTSWQTENGSSDKKITFSRWHLLNFFLTISAISVILKEFILYDKEEIYPWGARFGEVWENLCLAYISSYIFYLIVVYVKELNDKVIINGFISWRIFKVFDSVKNILRGFVQESNGMSQGQEYPSQEVIEKIISKNPSWYEHFKNHPNQVKSEIALIFPLIPFLETELISNIMQIYGCNFFQVLAQTSRPTESAPVLSTKIWNYICLIQQLENYYNHKLKKYYKSEILLRTNVPEIMDNMKQL